MPAWVVWGTFLSMSKWAISCFKGGGQNACQDILCTFGNDFQWYPINDLMIHCNALVMIHHKS